MASYVEGRAYGSEAEPVGLLTEGAAGIAVVVLAILALAGISAVALTAIAAIIIGVGLMVQGFNAAAENASGAAAQDCSAAVMVDCMAGGAGIVLGILALIGVSTGPLLPAALIVFGGALLLSGALAMRGPSLIPVESGLQMAAYRGSASATGGVEILTGIAAVVLGILSLVMTNAGVLVMVGYIVVGAALLIVSATFNGAVVRVFTRAAE